MFDRWALGNRVTFFHVSRSCVRSCKATAPSTIQKNSPTRSLTSILLWNLSSESGKSDGDVGLMNKCAHCVLFRHCWCMQELISRRVEIIFSCFRPCSDLSASVLIRRWIWSFFICFWRPFLRKCQINTTYLLFKVVRFKRNIFLQKATPFVQYLYEKKQMKSLLVGLQDI